MLLLLSLTAIPVTAAINGRVGNIKSHGVFVGINGTDEVVLDSADLRYLANQLDVLDQTIRGLTLQSNASIEYTYHVHKKGDGTESSDTIYSTVNPGGCYFDGGHTHDKIGACPYTQSPNTYHIHSGSPTSGGGCYTVPVYKSVTCTVYQSGCMNSYTGYDGQEHCQYTLYHTSCGRGTQTYNYPAHSQSNHVGARSWQQTCTVVGGVITGYATSCKNLPLNAGSQKIYSCGSPTNTWVIGCGKTTSSIDSAYIVFN